MIKKVFVDGVEIGRLNYQIRTIENSIFISLFRLKPEFRGRGYFKYLFNGVISIAKKNNINTLMLSVGGEGDIEDKYLLNLYKRYGFIGDKRRMILDIRNI